MVPKKRFSDHFDMRNVPKGHSTETKTTVNKKPLINAIFHVFQEAVRCQKRSRTKAGTMSRIGKCAGTRWVVVTKTGPSFGCAGTSGKSRIWAITNSVIIAAHHVAVHRWRIVS